MRQNGVFMIFDTHAHYDDKAFDEDRDSLLSSFRSQNIAGAILACAEFHSIEPIVNLCNQYDYLYPTIGVHPNEVLELTPENRIIFEEAIEKYHPVAIGEIGFEYHFEEPSREIQKEAFLYQLDLATKYNLPVIIHSRDASEDTFNIMKNHPCSKKGVIHCYSGSPEMALEYIKLGYYIGVGGVVTFKNGRKLKETVAAIPMDRILLETDCPYLAPTPHRGERNSSLYLPLVVEEIANIKGISTDEVEDITLANAEKLFNIHLTK